VQYCSDDVGYEFVNNGFVSDSFVHHIDLYIDELDCMFVAVGVDDPDVKVSVRGVGLGGGYLAITKPNCDWEQIQVGGFLHNE